MAKKYIDADKAIEEARLLYCKNCNSYNGVRCSACGFDDAMTYIEDAPTADVVEVKHGKWVEDAYYDNPCVCSYCGVEAPYFNKFEETFDYDWEENLVSTGYETIKEYIRTPYCPYCGAKMDGSDTE